MLSAHDAALAYAHAAAQQPGEERGDGHEAQAAYLDEQEYHQLPEAGPVRRRVHQHEAVTHEALTAVKSAVTKAVVPPLCEDTGSMSSIVPAAMTVRKPRAMVWTYESCRIFIT